MGADAKGLLLVATENAIVDATASSIRIVSLYLNNCCTYKKKSPLLIKRKFSINLACMKDLVMHNISLPYLLTSDVLAFKCFDVLAYSSQKCVNIAAFYSKLDLSNFYPKRPTLHARYTFFQLMHSLGIEHMTLVFLALCSTV